MIHVVAMECLIGLPLLIHIELCERIGVLKIGDSDSEVLKIEESESEVLKVEGTESESVSVLLRTDSTSLVLTA
jgi:hypothetical protein